MQEIASKNAPHISVVLPHYAFGGLMFLAITLLICLNPDALTQHHFNPKLLAITHLAVLGWITMVIFGALYQIIPVVMEVKLFSERLGKLSFALLCAGTILLSITFWYSAFGYWMYVAGSMLLLSVIVFGINVGISGSRSEKKSIERRFILTAAGWLIFTAAVGLALAVNLAHPYLRPSHLELLKLHAHAGIVGWFLLLIIGVASRLLPMFLVSHNLAKTKLRVAFYLINVGLAGLMFSFYFGIMLATILSGILVVAGVVSFLTFIAEAYKKRLKASLDIGMQQTALSFIILLLPIGLFFVFSFYNAPSNSLVHSLPAIYGGSILIGFISSLILGQTYKTLPFIVWLDAYRSKVGKGKIPLPKDLYSHKVAKAQLWTYAIGFVVLMGGIGAASETWISIGGGVLVMAALLYNFNLFKIIFHNPTNHGFN